VTRANPHPLAFPALILGNVALAFGPWLVRLADTGAVAAGFWRLTLALPLLWLVGAATKQTPHWPRRTLALLIFAGALFYALDLAAWNVSIRLTKLTNATLFGNCGSFVLVAYALIAARRLPTAIQSAALVLAVLGAALLMGSSYELDPRYFKGDALALFAAILYGGYLIALDRARRTLSAMPALFLATAFAVPMLLLMALVLGDQIWPHNWTPLLILALTSQVIGQGLLVYSLGVFPPLVVGLALLSQPAIAALIGWLVYGEVLSITDWIGAVAIGAALVLVRLPSRVLPRAAAEPS
jgi:drug/metabolite transporter (DMT)-like permease